MAEQLDEREFLTERNVAQVRRAYGTFGTEGFDEGVALELITEDVVIRDRPEAPDPQEYHGLAGVQAALEASDESFEEFSLEPTEITGVGSSHVVVVLKMSGRGRGSGVPVEETIAHLWTMREGKAVEMQVYSDPADALRDARAAE
jgi:ketosteroid isomerase-like protein